MEGLAFFVTFQKIDFLFPLSKYSYYRIIWQVALVLSLVTLKGELIFSCQPYTKEMNQGRHRV